MNVDPVLEHDPECGGAKIGMQINISSILMPLDGIAT